MTIDLDDFIQSDDRADIPCRLPSSDYYYEALSSIPQNHSHRDELISLLIDQVIDDTYH